MDTHNIMEFLDPEQKRRRTIKLFIMYFLTIFAITLGTFAMILLVQGYNFRKKQGVVQNGLVFVDSKPVSGIVWLNGQKKDKTNARLVLPADVYSMKITSDGYRDWTKSFILDGGSVRYFTYPKLIPNTIQTSIIQNMNLPPIWSSQSPDRRWLIYQQNINTNDFAVFDTSKPTTAPLVSKFAPDIYSESARTLSEIKPIEWSDDNKHLLILQTFTDGTMNYAVVDRDKPDSSVNITKKLSLNKDQSVKLKDKKWDKYFVLDKSTQILTSRDLNSPENISNIATKVVFYKSYGSDKFMYISYDGASENMARVIVLDGANSYNLKPVARDLSLNYQLDIAKFDGAWMYASSSSADHKVYIYKNPLNSLSPNNTLPPQTLYDIRLDKPQYISFSDNARFLSMQSASNFVVYDGELKQNYRYTLPNKLGVDQKASWVDGHRMSFVESGQSKIFEFDGKNIQTLTASLPNNNFNPYFDRDYNYVFTFLPLDSGKSALQSGSLIANKK